MEKNVLKINSCSSEEEEKEQVMRPPDSFEKNKNFQLDVHSELYQKLQELPGAVEYISKLLKIIKKYDKKIIKLRKKLTKFASKDCKDVSTQTREEVQLMTTTESAAENENEVVKSLTEEIKEAAETATQNMGFVYEETSGMYYDYNTGYYYNAEYGLYYDDKNQIYLHYDAENQNYEFHSSVASQPEVSEPYQKKRGKRKSKHKKKESKRQCTRNDKTHNVQEFEEGECSDSENSSSSSEDGNCSESSELSKQWPPCMRVMVKSTENPQMKVGTLYMLTCDGGTLGREGDHSILLPDMSASKHHLKFIFDKESDCYKVIDLGSRNGTLLNGKRISPSKQESDPVKLEHCSEIKIGTTVLVCHIHSGSQTCEDCEPGILQSKAVETEVIVKTNKSKMFKNELKHLKKLYGVHCQPSELKLAKGYTDRAQKRRETVGSQNPHEKTQTASVDESIAKENKGFKLLAKMGWKEGQSLGKDGEGILEPIKVEGNLGLAGIGCCDDNLPKNVCVPLSSEKQNIWKKTQERFEKLADRNEVFEDD